jgi:hypothetical protein
MLNTTDSKEILRQLGNQKVLIEFVPNSPTSHSEGVFAKGKLNPNPENPENISVTLLLTNAEIQIPCQDIKIITPL